MDINNLWLFAITALMLNITPGNDMLYVATRSTSQGVKAGIVSALGIMAGCMVHIVAAVVGLSAIVSKSATAFEIIKYIGAGYLIYLGIRSLLSKANSFKTAEKNREAFLFKNILAGRDHQCAQSKSCLVFSGFSAPIYKCFCGQCTLADIVSGNLV